MRKTVFGLVIATAALLAAPAQALDSDWRVKAGMLSLDGDESAATNVGLVYAMDLLGIAGVELEGNTSINDGEYAEFGGTLDYSATQLGGYATLTTPGPIYFKAKAGYVYTDIDIGGASENDTDLAYGIGAGFFGFELEYTRTSWEDVDVDMVSLAFGF